jgi:hypothetical protein
MRQTRGSSNPTGKRILDVVGGNSLAASRRSGETKSF